VIDRATHLLRTRAGDLLAISVGVQVPIWFLLALVLRDDWASGASDNLAWFWLALFPDPVTFGILLDEAESAGPLGVVLSRALPSLGLAVVGAACGRLVHEWALGRPQSGTEALIAVLRRGHVLIALWAIIHVVEIVTCIGIPLGPLVFGVAAPLWGMESQLGPWRAFVRSFRLSLRRFWWLCLSIPIASLVAAITGGLLGGAGLPILLSLTGGWAGAGGTATTALAGALPHLVLDPLLATSMALLALDLKVQVEGYDLEVELAETDQAERARG